MIGGDVGAKGGLKGITIGKDTPTELPCGEDREPALDQVNPGRGSRCEVHMVARALGQPTMDQGGLVNSRIVEHHVNVQLGWNILIDRIQELAEFDTAVPMMALSDHRPSGHIQGREEIRGPVPKIIMGVAFDLAGAHGQDGGSRLSSLDLRLLIHAQDQGPVGRGQVEPDNVSDLRTADPVTA